MSTCRHCGQALNISQRDDEVNPKYKSCPSCSTNHGEEHIFYRHPEAFGTSERRVSPTTPDGAQSYCTRCRSGRTGPYSDAIKCSQIKT